MFRAVCLLMGGAVLALVVGLGEINGPAAAQEKKDAPAACAIELYKDNGDEFRFRIKSGDTLLATSGKGYKTKEDIMKIIDIIRKDVAKAKLDDQTKSK
jgi:uncharacterized protein YegP (UPF0339 family)